MAEAPPGETQVAAVPPAEAPGAVLGSLKVVDWTDQAGAYAARLLADLGADVVRIELAGEPAFWTEEQIAGGDGRVPASALERYVNLNKRSVRLNTGTPEGLRLLGDLLREADVVITSGDAARRWREAAGPHGEPGPATHVHVSPFGTAGGGARLVADDLVTLAASGLLSLGGYPDREPVAVYGTQTYFAGGISAAVAALLSVLARDAGQAPGEVDVSVQAVLASALEDATAEFDLTGSVRRRSGDEPREAGTGTFACKDGWIAMVAGKLGTTPAWHALVGWLCEQGADGAEALRAPEWSTLEHRRRPESIAIFREILESVTRRWPRQVLYAELQERRIAAAPVNSIADLLTDSQLAERHFFRQVDDGFLGTSVTYPGLPYRLPDHVLPGWTAAPAPGGHTGQVLADWLGTGDQQLAALRREGVIA